MSVRDLNYRKALGKATQTSSTRMFSPALWVDCPAAELADGTKDGFLYFDDLMGNYTQAANVAATSSTLDAPWRAFTDATAGSTISAAVSPTDAVGAMTYSVTTAQEGCIASLHSQNNLSCPVTLGGAAGALTAATRFWMEARVKFEHTTTQYASAFLGLAQVGRTITLGTIATGGAATAAIDHIGFLYKAAATTALSCYQGNGTATSIADQGTIAADTYTKLGMYWNGAVMTFYQDGTALGTTSALGSSQFPAGAALALYWQVLCGSDGTTTSAALDWVRYAFERTA